MINTTSVIQQKEVATGSFFTQDICKGVRKWRLLCSIAPVQSSDHAGYWAVEISGCLAQRFAKLHPVACFYLAGIEGKEMGMFSEPTSHGLPLLIGAILANWSDS